MAYRIKFLTEPIIETTLKRETSALKRRWLFQIKIFILRQYQLNMRLIITIYFLFFSFLSNAQFDYEIKKNAAEVVKANFKVPVHFFNTERLAWGKVESDCFESEVEYGKWFLVKVKSGQTRITLNTTDKPGFLSKPTVILEK